MSLWLWEGERWGEVSIESFGIRRTGKALFETDIVWEKPESSKNIIVNVVEKCGKNSRNIQLLLCECPTIMSFKFCGMPVGGRK